MRDCFIRLWMLFALSLLIPGCSRECGSVSGKITDANGTALEGVWVAVFPCDPLDLGEGGDKVVWVRSDSAGTFRCKIATGTYALSASHSKRVGSNLTYFTVPKNALCNLPMPVRLDRTGSIVQGRMKDIKNTPVNGMALFLQADAHGRPRLDSIRLARTSKGCFQVAMDPGDYYVQALTSCDLVHQGEWLSVGVQGATLEAIFEEAPSPAPKAVRQWIRDQAVPLDLASSHAGFPEMAWTVPWSRKAQVVGMGEATHGTHDFFFFKQSALKSLVESGSINHFAMELNVVSAFRIDAFIQGETLDPIKDLPPALRVEEIHAMLLWLRHYNAARGPSERVRFHGLDMDQPAPAFEYALAFFRRIDPATAAFMTRKLGGLASAESGASPAEEHLASAWLEAVDQLLSRLEVGAPSWPRKPSPLELGRVKMALLTLKQFVVLAKQGTAGAGLREAAMADHVIRLLQQGGVGARILVWAHNGHVSKAHLGHHGFPPMGWHLKNALGPSYMSLGLAFRRGRFNALNEGGSGPWLVPYEVGPAPDGTLDAALSSAEKPSLFLDLHKVPQAGKVRDWFRRPQGSWFFPLKVHSSDLHEHVLPGKALEQYDGIVFFENTSPTTFTQVMASSP